MSNLTLTAHVIQLASLRDEVAQREATIKAARAAFESTIAFDVDALAEIRRGVEHVEAEVRGLALIEHDRSGDAKPAPGVSIVLTKEYTVDEAAGLAWAQSTRLCLIPESLDVKGIKKLATVQALPFVTVSERPSVRLATDLAKALTGATAEAA